MVYVNNSWTAATEPLFEEAACLLVSVKDHFNVSGIYHSLSFVDTTIFTHSLSSTIMSLKNAPCTIVAGDMNINTWSFMSGDSSHLAITEYYLSLLAEIDLMPTVNKPTRGDSCLNHVHVTSRYHAKKKFVKQISLISTLLSKV